jgi:hypothetical protein
MQSATVSAMSLTRCAVSPTMTTAWSSSSVGYDIFLGRSAEIAHHLVDSFAQPTPAGNPEEWFYATRRT